jgi:hypothetical protein
MQEPPVLTGGSTQSFHTNAGILQHISPRPSPSTYFPVHRSLTIAPSDTILSQPKAASWNKPLINARSFTFIYVPYEHEINTLCVCVCHRLRKLTDFDETVYLYYGNVISLKFPATNTITPWRALEFVTWNWLYRRLVYDPETTEGTNLQSMWKFR